MAKNVIALKTKRERRDAPNYRMVNRANDRGEIYIYGIIGLGRNNMWEVDGISATDFATDLKALGGVKTIDLRIMSEGGYVDHARAIYNLLAQHPAEKRTYIDGLAASAASFIAMAGKTIDIAEGGFVMIHNARGGAYGTAEDLRNAAVVMDEYNTAIRNTYAARTKQSDKQLKAWMDEETWFTSAESVKYGFADTITKNVEAAVALLHPDQFKNLPASLMPKRAAAQAMINSIKRK